MLHQAQTLSLDCILYYLFVFFSHLVHGNSLDRKKIAITQQPLFREYHCKSDSLFACHLVCASVRWNHNHQTDHYDNQRTRVGYRSAQEPLRTKPTGLGKLS